MDVATAKDLKIGDRIADRRHSLSGLSESFGTVTKVFGNLLGIRWDDRHGFTTPYDRTLPRQIANFHIVDQANDQQEEPQPS